MKKWDKPDFWICLFSFYTVLFCLPFSYFSFSARMEFRIAMTETPTSAKTASHILVAPKAPSDNTIAFTPSAKTMFCFTINSVFLKSLRSMRSCGHHHPSAQHRSPRLSASDPMLPMAMPISALVSTRHHWCRLRQMPVFFLRFSSEAPVPPYLPATTVLHVLRNTKLFKPLPAASLRSPVSMTHFFDTNLFHANLWLLFAPSFTVKSEFRNFFRHMPHRQRFRRSGSNRCHLSNGFQIIASLYQHTDFGSLLRFRRRIPSNPRWPVHMGRR